MIWEELLVDRSLSNAELAHWLEVTFSVPASAVAVLIEDSAEPVSDDILVLCKTAHADGEFAMRIMIAVTHPDLEYHESKNAVATLCQTAHLRALMSDDTLNPYRMLLINPDGDRHVVHLDVEELDTHERFVIASYETNEHPQGTS